MTCTDTPDAFPRRMSRVLPNPPSNGYLAAIVQAASAQDGLADRTIFELSRGLVEVAAVIETDPIARQRGPELRDTARELEEIYRRRILSRPARRFEGV